VNWLKGAWASAAVGCSILFASVVLLVVSASAQALKSATVEQLKRSGDFRIQIPVDPVRDGDQFSLQERWRVIACGDAVRRIRPRLGEDLEYEHLEAYLGNCFRRMKELPSRWQQILGSTLVLLKLPTGGTCTAFLVNRKIALTARHCFLPPRARVELPIEEGTVAASSIEGLGEPGKAWEVKGLRLVVDPLAPDTPVFARLVRKAGIQFSALDLVGISPRYVSEFPAVPAGVIFPTGTTSSVKVGTRLIVASLFSADVGIVVDDLPSCKAVSVNGQAGYLRHRCQTLPGSSGAPVLIFSQDSELVAVALHAGPEGNMSSSVPVVLENEAALIPNEFIEEVRRLAGPSR